MSSPGFSADVVRGSALWTVVAVVAAAITLPFGESVIGVQLSAIGQSFQADSSTLQWLVNSYMLTFATSILVAGVAADHLGRRRLFAAGLALVGMANALAMIAPGLASLIALRALAGFGAGTLLATGPALLAARFPENDRPRAQAFAAFGSAAGSGIALGPLIGGWVMDLAGWRAVFAVYLPFVLVSLVLLPRIAPSRDEQAPPVDSAGIILFVAVLAALVLAIQGTTLDAAWRAALVGAAVLLLCVLVRLERGRAHPAIAPGLFAHPVFRVMSLTMICWQIGVAVSMVYVPAVVVAGLGGSPALAGASILPMAVMLFAATPLGPWLVARRGTAGFVSICIAAMAAGDALIWMTLGMSAPWSGIGLMTGLAVIGLGGGAANGSMDNLAMGTLPAARAGMAAGLFQTVRIGSAALAVAAAGSVLAVGQAGSGRGDTALVARYAGLAGVAALIMAGLAMLCLVFLYRARQSKESRS